MSSKSNVISGSGVKESPRYLPSVGPRKSTDWFRTCIECGINGKFLLYPSCLHRSCCTRIFCWTLLSPGSGNATNKASASKNSQLDSAPVTRSHREGSTAKENGRTQASFLFDYPSMKLFDDRAFRKMPSGPWARRMLIGGR